MSAPTTNEPRKLKGCEIPLSVGAKVKCYPTRQHWDRGEKGIVKATILKVKEQRGYFDGCEISYYDWRTKTNVTESIGGGSGHFLLEVCVSKISI